MTAVDKELSRISNLPPTIQQIELAALLSSCFKKFDVSLTVVGGAAVQYYTDAEYVTGDLNAILVGDTKEIIDSVMDSLGFKRTSSYRHFEHPSFPFIVEFPPSPVAVGSRHLEIFNILKFDTHQVRLIRVEDVIMDRIVAGAEWKDPPSIDQAKLLWVKNKKHIDQTYLIDFAKKEGYTKTLQEIMKY